MVMEMERVTIIGIIFAILVVGWILATGQWAYGNVVGPLVNHSKIPQLKITYVNAYENAKGTYLILNITDCDGPDAYPASAPMMEIYNSTWHVFLYSYNISNDTVKVIQAPWNENKKDYTNWYSGFVVILGSEAQFQLQLPFHLSPGTYHIKLYTPAVSSKVLAKQTATFTIS
ncbi:thiosulphate-quinone oxidoreductase (TQO) DoxA subunit [Acidianus hospitalis W1]|uniref:Thiosulphate-quinone oxidoreductase (TQO) DoxA subunit n=2 Tax=Acidianus hospitalis TaxID=563177 RepID=F4B441_ACIHW|nr:thiosulphate-quinone oxidoreductase (TQO) DoxA subunit [Acidianus hospitalis W1]